MKKRPIDPSSALARNVREHRERLGLSQEELAKAAKMDPAALSRIENGHGGERGVGLGRIGRLAEALQVAPSTLLEA